MMDYCARETTIAAEPECCREMSTSEIVKEIRKELMETELTLMRIKLSLDGKGTEERNTEEPRCLLDEIKQIEHIAVDCMGLSHEIHDQLFRSM